MGQDSVACSSGSRSEADSASFYSLLQGQEYFSTPVSVKKDLQPSGSVTVGRPPPRMPPWLLCCGEASGMVWFSLGVTGSGGRG